MNIKHLFLLLTCILLGSMSLFAQQKGKCEINSFSQDQFGSSTEKIDASGSYMALIKVVTNHPDDNLREFNFNFGNLRHEIDGRDHGEELWIYVQKNAKMITIRHPKYSTIEKHDLGITIQAGKVYYLHLKTPERIVYTQMVQFNITPRIAGATILIKGSGNDDKEELFGITDASGAVARNLSYDTYTYRVMATNYYDSDGHFILQDKNTTHNEAVTLRPNFSEITFTVDADADIYINNEKKGHKTWSGYLKAGNYQVDCRQEKHKSSSKYITVADNDNRTITLDKPTPITGTLAVTSTPLGATIKIDGKDVGKTPRNIDVIIGNHDIELSLSGYQAWTQTTEINENKTTTLNAKLDNVANISFNSVPSGAQLFIDGKNVGTTPCRSQMASGDYTIQLTYPKYHTLTKKMHINIDRPTLDFKLPKELHKKYSGYVDVGINAGTIGFGGVMKIGGYLKNFNIEGSVLLSSSNTSLWRNTGISSAQYTINASPALGIKTGYGFVAGSRFRITPQIGINILMLRSSIEQIEHYENSDLGNNYPTPDYTDVDLSGKVLCISLGARTEIAFTRHFGASITPEVMFAPVKSELSKISSDIKRWQDGFNIHVGLYLSL